MKRLCFIIAFIMILTFPVYGSSRNTIVETGKIKGPGEPVNAVLKIEPNNEVATGAYIEIEFENALVFSSDVINGKGKPGEIGYKGSTGYQYRSYGNYKWNGRDGFYDVMEGRAVSQVPYRITRLDSYNIRVDLCNIPSEYADRSLVRFNGSIDEPYYSIPLPVYVKDEGPVRIKVTGKANDTSLRYGNYIFNEDKSNNESVTETSTEATTEESVITTEKTNVINNVRVTIGSSIMTVNSRDITIDSPPYIQAGSWATLVPLRAVSLALADGYSGNGSINTVSWDANTKTAIITYNGNTVAFTAGSGIADINGEDVYMERGVTAEIRAGRMYVPFRMLGEALGADVSWDANTKTAIYN